MIGWLYLASEWIIRIVMTPIVPRRRGPSASMSWLLIIYFIPWLGLFLYVLIGENRLGYFRRKRHHESRTMVRLPDAPEGTPDSVTSPNIARDQHDLVKLTARVGGAHPIGGNDCELITDSDEMVERLIEEINAAQRTVHLLYYIFAVDETGGRVSYALIEAAKRGVKCRVLVDAVGSRPFLGRTAARLRAQGVDVRAALPVNPLRRQLERMDLRNHRKLAVIDARAALTGSQNIVNADYGQTRVGAWRDMTVLVRGPVIAQLQAIFRADWHFETGEVIGQEEIDEDWTPRGEIAVQAAPSGPTYGTDAAHRLIVAAVQEANERLIITSPYFVPDEAFILAIELAVLRGVQVDLVVPERANHPLVQAAGRAFYGTILEAGARIHLHQTGLLHAKTLSVDDAFALVGSANFDIRSFFLNFELNLLLYGRQAAEALRKRQMEYIAESRLLSKDVWLKRPGWRRTADDLAKLCSPLL